MIKNRAKSYGLVIVQLGCVAGLCLSGPVIPQGMAALLLGGAALGLGVWAMLTVGLGRFGILPDPLHAAKLRTSGPYAVIRHPMYSALLLLCLALLLNKFNPLRLTFYLTLFLDLIVKLRYEERLLQARFPDYADYMTRSWRLVPFLY